MITMKMAITIITPTITCNNHKYNNVDDHIINANAATTSTTTTIIIIIMMIILILLLITMTLNTIIARIITMITMTTLEQ